jgi:hypothetical protein
VAVLDLLKQIGEDSLVKIRFGLLCLAIISIFAPAAHAESHSQSKVITWDTNFAGPSLQICQGSCGYAISDLNAKIKWRTNDYQADWFTSNLQPFSIRFPSAIQILDQTADCVDVPVIIHREVSSKIVSDENNPLNIYFFKNSPVGKEINPEDVAVKIGPGDWANVQSSDLQIQLPICSKDVGYPFPVLIKAGLPRTFPKFFRITYSTPLSEVDNEIDPRCPSVANNLCTFSGGGAVRLSKFMNGFSMTDDILTKFLDEMKVIQDRIDTKPCEIPYEVQGGPQTTLDFPGQCDLAQRNIEFLKKDLDRVLAIPKQANLPVVTTPTPPAAKVNIEVRDMGGVLLIFSSKPTVTISVNGEKGVIGYNNMKLGVNTVLIKDGDEVLYSQNFLIDPVPELSPSASPTVATTASPVVVSKTPQVITSPQTKPSAVKITITCTKGKVIKKVTSTKPVCPIGYKKK